MKIRRLLFAAVATIMVGVNIGGGVIPVLAAAGDDYDYAQMHPAAYHVPDGDNDESNDLILYKTAEYVPGYANKWKVTLRIEAPTVTATSDTVLVIDRSNSMNGTPLTNAKEYSQRSLLSLENYRNLIIDCHTSLLLNLPGQQYLRIYKFLSIVPLKYMTQ